jgi:hypothetical protein
MAPKKAPKKSEDTQEGDIISDTTPHAIDSIKSWTQISEFLECELKNAHPDSENHYRDIAESELHKIVARPRLVAYNDMISWALEKVDIPTRSILNDQGVIVGSFRPEHIQVMYKLSPNPKHTFNAEFLAEFQRKECTEVDQTYPDIIREWWRCPSIHEYHSSLWEKNAKDAFYEICHFVIIPMHKIFFHANPLHF